MGSVVIRDSYRTCNWCYLLLCQCSLTIKKIFIRLEDVGYISWASLSRHSRFSQSLGGMSMYSHHRHTFWTVNWILFSTVDFVMSNNLCTHVSIPVPGEWVEEWSVIRCIGMRFFPLKCICCAGGIHRDAQTATDTGWSTSLGQNTIY